MNLGRGLRALYEAHMKELRDRNARDEYVWDEGKAEGEMEKLISIIRKMSAKEMSAEAIADILEEDSEFVAQICELLRIHPDWKDDRIHQELKSPLP